MSKIRTNKILIPIDFSKTALTAIKYGAFMAQYTKGEVVLLHVQNKNDLLEVIMPAVNLKNVSVITDFLSQRLEGIAADIRKKYGIKVTPIVSTGHITSEIVNIAEETKSGLIVMGTHGTGATRSLFVGSNSYRVITQSEIPVMTIQKAADKLGFQNIVLPIDLSLHARQKVKGAIDFAEKFSAHLHVIGLVHVNEKHDKFKMEVIMGQVQKLADKKKVACTTTIQVADSRAKKTVAYAKKVKADLIIATTDQDAELSKIILGPYIHQLIHESKIPVICVPPELNPDLIDIALDFTGI